MKKLLCYLLIASMLITSCIGCGKQTKESDKKEPQSEKTDTQVEASDNEEDVETETPEFITSNETVVDSEPQEATHQQDTKPSTSQSNKQDTTQSNNKQNNTNNNSQNNNSQHKHTFSKKVTNPTCTTQGYTTYSCSCGESYKSDYISAKGHTEVIDKAVAATSTSTGLTEGKHCSACGSVLVAQTVVPKKNSPSANSTFDYKCGTYKTFSSEDWDYYNEYVIEEVIIETEDVSETTFNVKVTLKIVVLEIPENAPDYIKGDYLFQKDGKGNYGAGTFSMSNVDELQNIEVTFTNRNMTEGNYTLKFYSYF